MKTLSDINAFIPKSIPVGTDILSNAQIAQIMVRHEEVMASKSAIYSSVKTLSAVRDLRRAIIGIINGGRVVNGDEILEKIKTHIGLSDENIEDCEFD